MDQSALQVTGTQTHCHVQGGCASDDRQLLFVNSEQREQIIVSVFFFCGCLCRHYILAVLLALFLYFTGVLISP